MNCCGTLPYYFLQISEDTIFLLFSSYSLAFYFEDYAILHCFNIYGTLLSTLYNTSTTRSPSLYYRHVLLRPPSLRCDISRWPRHTLHRQGQGWSYPRSSTVSPSTDRARKPPAKSLLDNNSLRSAKSRGTSKHSSYQTIFSSED